MATATNKARSQPGHERHASSPGHLRGVGMHYWGYLQVAIDKFKSAEAAAAFKTYKMSSARASWPVGMILRHPKHVLERFSGPAGPVYGRGMTRAIQNAFIQQHMQPSNALIQSVIEKAVHAQGGLGITPDEAAEIASKWATFIKLQRGRIPPEMISELGLSSVKDRKRHTDCTVDGVAGSDGLVPGSPSAGREFGDSSDGKIGQAREHRTQVVSDR